MRIERKHVPKRVPVWFLALSVLISIAGIALGVMGAYQLHPGFGLFVVGFIIHRIGQVMPDA